MSARRSDPEASRAAILEAAERLFLDRGFAGTSMSEIATASGVTKSLIHHHFGSKEALWDEVKRTTFAGYHAQQMELFARAEPTPALLEASLRIYFRFLYENPRLLRMMWWMMLEDDRVCTEMVDELTERGVAAIEAAQQGGLVRTDVSARSVLTAFLGLARGYFLPPSQKCDSQTPDEAADQYLDAAWKILSEGALTRD